MPKSVQFVPYLQGEKPVCERLSSMSTFNSEPKVRRTYVGCAAYNFCAANKFPLFAVLVMNITLLVLFLPFVYSFTFASSPYQSLRPFYSFFSYLLSPFLYLTVFLHIIVTSLVLPLIKPEILEYTHKCVNVYQFFIISLCFWLVFQR